MRKKSLEQYERMGRWYARLEMEYCRFKDIDKKAELEDLFYSFFQNCYHVRDWLINSKVVTEKEYEREKKNIQPGLVDAMRICRDLCNGSKHLTIKSPSIDQNLTLSHIRIQQPDSPLKFIYLVEIQGKDPQQAIDIATLCTLFWKEFFESRTLL